MPDCVCDKFLSCAALSLNKDRRISRSNLLYESKYILKLSALAYKFERGFFPYEFLFKKLILNLELSKLIRPVYKDYKLIKLIRLCKVIISPVFHCLNRCLYGSPACENYYRRRRRVFFYFLHKCNSVHSGHQNIKEDNIKRIAF